MFGRGEMQMKRICLFLGAALVFTVNIRVCFSQQSRVPLSGVLNPDGTIDTSKASSASLDPGGYRMITDARGRPRFVPESAAGDDVSISGVVPDDDANWDNAFGLPGLANLNLFPRAMAVSGSVVYVGGDFISDFGGGLSLRSIAKWNGHGWSALGTGLSGPVHALAVSGTNLYVGGVFTNAGGVTARRIARWDGNSWSALGSGVGAGGSDTVRAIAVIGNDVYVGGTFTNAGTVAVNGIAKWDGSNWSALENGVTDQFGVSSTVRALAVSGTDLYVGGQFSNAGSITANRIAKWNGSSWSALGTGVGGFVHALAVSGSNLYVGGSFTSAGGSPANRIARWDGNSWSALGSGVDLSVNALAVSGADLFVGGDFTMAGGMSANRIARWDGSGWSTLGQGLPGTPVSVLAVAVLGSDVYVGGNVPNAGVLVGVNNIAKWNGSDWFALGQGLNEDVFALAGGGPYVYAGGNFTQAGASNITFLARFDGTRWTPLGSGLFGGAVQALALSGTNLYVGGVFTNAGGMTARRIARWDGNSWSTLGGGITTDCCPLPQVLALAVDGTNVYAGGLFTNAGGVSASNIARWNGNSWSALGDGFDDRVTAIAVLGGTVYAGGWFQHSGTNSVSGLAKWNGSSWSQVGEGFVGGSAVYALAANGTNLYVGGYFIIGNTNPAVNIARWNGSAFTPLGAVGFANVYSIALIGTNLYIGGDFTNVNAVAASRLARWDGNNWSALGSGLTREAPGGRLLTVNALAAVGDSVYVGGVFRGVGNKPSFYIGHWTEPFVPVPLIGSIGLSGNDVILQMQSELGNLYQLQVTPSLAPPSWLNSGASKDGTGGLLMFTDPGGANQPARFYRIQITTPTP
jgi:hypothetical protein